MIPRFDVLGVPVAAIQIPDVIAQMCEWIAEGSSARYLTLTGMHGVMEAQRSQTVMRAYGEADLVLPDGMPMVWLGRGSGHQNLRRRVYGPELMWTFFGETRGRYRHYLYGGDPGVAELLTKRLNEEFAAQIVGAFSPPFRPISDEELKQHAEAIRASNADIVWLGISTPKQDVLMWRLRTLNPCAVMLGVGAAFDFHAGVKRGAPRFMQENGLEWLFRLCSEPRRLWNRYLYLGPQFVWMLLMQRLGLRRRQYPK